ncbi:MAG: hypothetical protein SFY32_14325 [Bacteroidota bacterium]|nr:hypothetical protein [Bacteroidota bacterium]
MNNKQFKLDRTKFSYGKMSEETEKHDYAHLTEKEQNDVFQYLMSVAYGFVNKPWPKMDRTKFEIEKRE